MDDRQTRVTGNAGFTLLELVTVLACIAVISGIATYQFLDWLPKYRLRSAARDLFSAFQTARMQAIRDSGEFAIVFDTENMVYHLVSCGKNRRYDGRKSSIDDVVEKKVRLADYGSGVRYGYGRADKKATQSGGAFSPGDEVSFQDDVAEFNARGMANKMGYVYLQNSRQAACAVAAPTRAGVVSLKCWDGEKWI